MQALACKVLQIGWKSGKWGKNPPLPRSREGNESSIKSHCYG